MIGLGSVAAVLAVASVMQAAAEPRTVLVELFTSEGCSSCPPADALLGKINGRRAGSGDLVVGLSEHVTYWNHLGWADPFSQELYTERQGGYSERFHLEGVYTPQMVVNGEAEVVGSDERAVARALAAGRGSSMGLRIDAVRGAAAGRMEVQFSVTGEAPRGGAEVYAVIAEDMASSGVARGENAGRRLSHVAVARTLTRVGAVTGAETKTVLLAVPASVGQTDGARHLVLFVQARGLGQVLAVESRAL